MMKIVFFDIDGTLLDHEKSLPASAKKAIKTLQENGVFVAISTGRAPFMFKALREELDIDTFVSFNGQYVVFENNVIYQNPLSPEEVEKLKNHAGKQDTALVFMNEQTMKSTVQNNGRVKEAMGTLKFPHPEQDGDFYKDKEIYQSLLFCSEEEEHQYIGHYDKFRFIRWHELCLDVLPAGGSKAEGIKILMDKIGFKLDDVYAFGDGLNDIEMLQAVGHGVAMGNALEEVKKHADFVTKDVDDDGILYGLKHLKLI
ncbi:hydrolase Cof [Bacillus sp. MUM 13]|nr:Cof-type HAD-IIB family hydrolase [Bacillus sp. MUM 13]OIK11533.1 hydrolase Cof [Bacillus sp. MUM 13]